MIYPELARCLQLATVGQCGRGGAVGEFSKNPPNSAKFRQHVSKEGDTDRGQADPRPRLSARRRASACGLFAPGLGLFEPGRKRDQESGFLTLGLSGQWHGDDCDGGFR